MTDINGLPEVEFHENESHGIELHKIQLHEIQPFFIKTKLSREVIKNYILEFEKKRSEFGYKNNTLREKYNIRKDFSKQYGLKITHDSIISLEIWKQGRNRIWLHDRLKQEGFTLSYLSMCQKITGYGFMPLKLKQCIYKYLNIH